MKNLYVGAAGVLFALDELRRRGHAETTLDLPDLALRTVELFRARPPDLLKGMKLPDPPESSLLEGETGILLVACRLAPSIGLADDLHVRVRANRDNEAEEVMWGTPGTLMAARAMLEWTGEQRWRDAWNESAEGPDGQIRVQWCAGSPGIVIAASGYLDEELLLAGAELAWRTGPPGLEKGASICHGTAGNGYAFLKVFARTGDERWLKRARHFALHALGQVRRLRKERGRGRCSLWTGDLGVALYAADCLDRVGTYPMFDFRS